MALRRAGFDSYRVFLATGNQPENVLCYAGGELVGHLTFLEGPLEELPPAGIRDGGVLLLPYCTTLLPGIKDLLRSEEPPFLLLDEHAGSGKRETRPLEDEESLAHGNGQLPATQPAQWQPRQLSSEQLVRNLVPQIPDGENLSRPAHLFQSQPDRVDQLLERAQVEITEVARNAVLIPAAPHRSSTQ